MRDRALKNIIAERQKERRIDEIPYLVSVVEQGKERWSY